MTIQEGEPEGDQVASTTGVMVLLARCAMRISIVIISIVGDIVYLWVNPSYEYRYY